MKKLMLFLMVAIPIIVVMIVKLTATVAVGDVFISVESITLNEDSISAMVGDSLDLSFTIYPEVASNQDVFWNSSNESAAVVDLNGHVDFVGIGSGYISASTKDGNKTSQCSFYVGDTKVHQVKLTAAENFVHINDTLQLSANVLPNEATNQDVSFSSSDESIAEVDSNGLVTGLQEGYVTITVTTDEGGFTDSIDLAVIYPVEALVVEKEEVITSSKTYQIEYLVQPESATNKNVTFEVENPEIASVNHTGLVTFNKAGETKITLTTLDGNFQRTVKFIYTEGYAYDLILEEPSMIIDVDSAPVEIKYQTFPENLYSTKVEFSSYDENVAYVDAAGFIHAAKSGNTVINLKVQKSDKTYIQKQIYVTVVSPAKEILIDDGITAEKTYQLNPKASPDDAKDVKYYYHIVDEDKATVSTSGLVVFNTQSPCTVAVDIYANEDRSEVSKRVHITYTAGKVAEFKLLEKNITLSCGETAELKYEILPENATIKPMTLSIESNNPILGEGDVVEIVDGSIHALSGGTAVVKVLFVLYDNRVVEEYCEVNVVRQPTDLEIEINLEKYNNQYVTAQNVVEFSGKILPLDAAAQNIDWAVNDSTTAFIRGNTLIFNRVGFVTLTATLGQISKSVEIYYAGANPVNAEVNATFNGQNVPIPQKMKVGESFEVFISKIVPTYQVMPEFSLQTTNQKTLDPKGKVLQVENGMVKAVAGGSATLVVYIASSIRLNFAIEVERTPEKISILNADIQVTSSTVELQCEVLPVDTTNKTVVYVVEEENLATIEGTTLTFKQNGLVHITAFCQANESVRTTFTIEKVEKNVLIYNLENSSATFNKGEIITFNLDEEYTVKIEENLPLVAGEEVVQIQGKSLHTVSAGIARILVSTKDKKYHIQIVVNQLVEDIVFVGAEDTYENEYVVGKDVVALDFEVRPIFATNAEISFSIVDSISADGTQEMIAYISDKKLYFTKAGTVKLQVVSADKNVSKTISIRFTGGDALDAQLSVGDSLVLNVGDEVEIKVVKWLPVDVTNTRISLYEINASGKKIIEINSKTKTVRAVDSGKTKLMVELSNGLLKEVEVICMKKVENLVLEEEVITASSTHVIQVDVLPVDATNKTLKYQLKETDLATLEGNTLHFKKAGRVEVIVSTTDGSGVEKTIYVTSTMGFLSKIVLRQQSVLIKKGLSFNLEVQTLPVDAENSQVSFKIISQTGNIINLMPNGQVLAVSCGSAVVRVFAQDFYGQEIFADCEISVYENISSFELQFEQNVDKYQNQNTFITSKNELAFQVVCAPTDAQINGISYQIHDTNMAKIENGKIIFLQKGSVSITFTCVDITSKEVSKTFNFYYVGNDLIEATLDKTNWQNNTLNLKVGQNFKFSLAKALPSDNENLTFSIQDVVEKRIDPNKQVARFDNGTIYALNGGTFEFTLYVNGYKLEKIILNVIRDATAIVIDGQEDVYISFPYYKIRAHVAETDTQQSEIGFKTESKIATISQDGNLTFSDFGECEVLVYVVENPSIFKSVKVTYTQSIKSIEFNKTRENLYVGESIELKVVPQPYTLEAFNYTMRIDNETAAMLVKQNDCYRLIGLAGGTVTVTAEVEGREISATRTFNIFEKIKDIKLELDKTNDTNGHGGYRIFGTRFFDEKNNSVNTYKMKVALLPTQVSMDLLEWSSSDQTKATVDQNGVVTFLAPGRVVITVKQKTPYEGASVVSDSYEFVLIDGINVYNYQQFKIANGTLTTENKNRTENFSTLVLQSDISLTEEFKTFTFGYDVMGNGFKIDHSKVINAGHFYITKNNIVLDNVVLKAVEYINGAQLKDTGNVLEIKNCSNVILYNTTIEGAEAGIRTEAAQIKMDGCIIRNCLLVGMKAAPGSKVIIKDTIFASSYIGIMFSRNQTGVLSTISLEGEVRFYNWSTLQQVEQSIDLKKYIDQAIPGGSSLLNLNDVYKQIEDTANEKGGEYVYAYNGKTYYNFAILSFKADVLGKTFSFEGSISKTNLSPLCNYSNFAFSCSADVLGVQIPLEFSAISLKADKPFIKPGETYLDNPAIEARIRQKCRF